MRRNTNTPTGATAAAEERLRDAFGAAASTISAEDLPPRPAPAGSFGPGRAGRAARGLRAWAPRARVRALAPVAAAVSMTAIGVTAVVVVPGLMNGSPSGALAAGPLGGAPRFFAGVTAEVHSKGPLIDGVLRKATMVTKVKVYSSANGRPVAVVTAPTPLGSASVARLGDDHTFVIAAYDKKACATHFLKFSISEAGKASAITPLSVPQISGDVEQIAASADGKVLGFALSGCAPQGLQMAVIHLDTGKVTRWSNPGVGGSPSLNADGSVYGFVSSRTERSQKVTGWTIPTDAPAGPLYQHARKVLDLPNNVDTMILSPSGAQLYVETQDGSSQGPMVLDLYRTSTGTLIKQVIELIPAGQPLAIAGLSMDAASQHLLAYDLGDGSQVKAFDLRTGRHLSLTVPRLEIDGTISTLAW
ncbi:MAG: hypothetical protein ABJB47_02070 [Actinomycetota bacterium]